MMAHKFFFYHLHIFPAFPWSVGVATWYFMKFSTSTVCIFIQCLISWFVFFRIFDVCAGWVRFSFFSSVCWCFRCFHLECQTTVWWKPKRRCTITESKLSGVHTHAEWGYRQCSSHWSKLSTWTKPLFLSRDSLRVRRELTETFWFWLWFLIDVSVSGGVR